MAGIIDKIKELFGGAKSSAQGAGSGNLKETAGNVKDKVDDVVDQNRERIPDAVENAYDKASAQAEKVIPGDDAPSTNAPHTDDPTPGDDAKGGTTV